MFNLFNIFKRKRYKKQVARLSELSSVFGTVEKLMSCDLLHWDARTKRLFIAAPLADFYISQGAEKWGAFLQNVYQYTVYQYFNKEWDRIIRRKQSKALSEAKKTNIAMTEDDKRRVQQSVLDSIEEGEVRSPEIAAFEFYVVADTGEKQLQTTLVGSYDPDTELFNMVSWDEVQKHIALAKMEENINVP